MEAQLSSRLMPLFSLTRWAPAHLTSDQIFRKMKSTILPNNRQVYCFDKNEAYILYLHVSEYLKHGITVKQGDLIFDVGANIGLFTIMLHDLFGEDVSVYAFEPIPDTYGILERNLQTLSSQTIYSLPLGLSDANKLAEFSYSPDGSALSSIYPYDDVEQSMIKRAFIRTLNYLPKNAPFLLKFLNKMPSQVLNFVLSRMAQKAFDFRQVTCQMKTVSELIAEFNIPVINLLKIDVEKSELDVIRGIEEKDWEKINQIIIEVHDISDRISVLTHMLHSHGFKRVHVEQEIELMDTNIHCIYALR